MKNYILKRLQDIQENMLNDFWLSGTNAETTRGQLIELKSLIEEFDEVSHDEATQLNYALYNLEYTLRDMSKVTNKNLADTLGVSEQAVKQYPPLKKELMKLGLKIYPKIEITTNKEEIKVNLKIT